MHTPEGYARRVMHKDELSLVTGHPEEQYKMHQVTACEVFPTMVTVAQHLVAHNHLAHQIQILPIRSDEIQIAQEDHHSQQNAHDPEAAGPTGSVSVDTARHQQQHPPTKREVKLAQRAQAAKLEGASAAGQKQHCMDRKADVIVTEIFDSELLGEGILPTMRHAVKHLLQVRVQPPIFV